MRYIVLGPVGAERADDPIALGGPQQRRLLGVLLVERDRAVSTERLVDALWPDGGAPDGAARSVLTYVSRLRAALGDGRITTVGSAYSLERRDTDSDVDQFEGLIAEAERSMPDRAIECYDRALAMWRGDPFGEFGVEWWAVAEAARLQELRVVAREQRAAALLAIGHHGRAIPDLESMALEHPLRERPASLLMQALHATGRQAEALRSYQGFRRRLADQTGLEPSPEFAALERRIAGTVEELTDVSIGRPLRGYTIHEAIGEGAFGRVYAATQPGTERRVAVKAIRPELADSSEFIRRFEAEAQLVARLEHPHIVPLYDYWREPGGAYLVFRLLTGGTARDAVVSGGAWSVARVSRLVEEIGGALMAAHAAGVTHNDVKASNVVLDDTGGAYLTDFGIAMSVGDLVDDRIVPTGEPAEVSDIRAFGWLLWELLAGTTPTVDSAARSSRPASRRETPVPTLIGRMHTVPEGLDAVLAKATAHIGGYSTVAELVLAWRAAVGPPDGAFSPTPPDLRPAVDSARRLAARALAQDVAAGINPYKGLRAFDEADAATFFGRSAAIDDLAGAVGRHPFVTVIGASGSGKSSLVRAGLVPLVRAAGQLVVVIVPGEAPCAALRSALDEVSTERERSLPLGPLIDHIARRNGGLLVVVDQLEECWTRCSADRREEFVDVVTMAIADDMPIRFVATVRADLLDRPLEHTRLGQLVGDGAFVLSPLSPADVEQIVVLPAGRAGVTVDEGVVASLVSEAAVHPGSLPLLQFALTELYDHRVDGVIGREHFDALGGMAGALGRRAEDVFTALDADGQTDARELFGRLIVPVVDGPDTRRRARRTELSGGAQQVADRFVDARLLVTDRDQSTREPTIEVAHEALLTRWERLAHWLDDDRRWLLQLQHLAVAAEGWDRSGRGDAELYRGARLELAIEAIELDGRTVSAVERDFVDAGRSARDAEVGDARRTARRLRRLLVGVGAALVVALIAGAVALVQRGEANDAAAASRTAQREASIEALVGRAESIRTTQRDTAALLAVEAYRLADTPRTRSALLSLFTDGQGFLDIHRLGGTSALAGIVMPDGATSFIVADDGALLAYDLDSGARSPAFPPPGTAEAEVTNLASSADGTLLAVAEASIGGGPRSTTITVYDVGGRSAHAPPIVIDGLVNAVAFGPRPDTLLVSRYPGGDVVGFDLATGDVLGQVPSLGVDANPNLARGGGLAVVSDNLFVVGSSTGTVRLVDADTFDVLASAVAAPHTSSTLAALADGSAVIGAGADGVMRIDITDQSEMVTTFQRLDYGRACEAMTVVERAGRFYCGNLYGRLDERDLETGQRTRSLDAQNGSTGWLWPARDGTELVSFGDSESVVSRWRLDGSGPITRTIAPDWNVDGYSPDGSYLLVGHSDVLGIDQDSNGFIHKVVDANSGDDVAMLDGLIGPVWIDRDTVAGLTITDAGLQVARYELDTHELIADGAVLDVQPTFVEATTGKERVLLAFFDDDRRSADLVQFAPNLQPVGPTIPIEDYEWMAISRTGRRIAVGTSTGIQVFDGDTGARVGEIEGRLLRGATITVSDQLFVSSWGGELIQYDLDTLQPIRTFGGSRGFVQEVNGTSDGSLITTRGGDRFVSIYDVASGVRIGTPITIPDDQQFFTSLKLDGTSLAIGGGAGTSITVWDLDPEHWVDAACRVAGRNLTQEEWNSTIGDLAEYRSTCEGM